MAMTINTNIQSLNAQRNLGTSQSSLATSMQRLSSGLRINSAKDDAAGMAIAERMSAQVRGLNQAQRNANDGVSLAQTAEGALGTIGGNLQRIRELAVQSRNATNSTEDRKALNAEVQLLKQEIQRVAETTDFNGTKLLNGSFVQQAFQGGADQGQTIDIAQIANANIDQLGSWTSAVTNAKVTGVAPVGAAAIPGAPAVATVSAGASTFTTATATVAGKQFDFKIDGTSVFSKTSGSSGADLTVTAAEVQTALDTFVANSNGAYTVAGTVAAGNLVVTKADGTDINIESTSDFDTAAGGFAATFAKVHTGGTPAVPAAAAGGFAAISGTEFQIQGIKADGTQGNLVNIEVGTATSAGDRVTAMVNAINAKTQETGVTASSVNGKLSLESKYGDFEVKTSMAAPADFTKASGLSAGKASASTAAGDVAFAKGSAKTGFADLDISDVTGADNAILAMDSALKSINSARADLGAIQNRFESVVSNLSVNSENLSASKSRITDADFAAETANLSRSQILQQAGTAMVAQANQLPQGVLSLLR